MRLGPSGFARELVRARAGEENVARAVRPVEQAEYGTRRVILLSFRRSGRLSPCRCKPPRRLGAGRYPSLKSQLKNGIRCHQMIN